MAFSILLSAETCIWAGTVDSITTTKYSVATSESGRVGHKSVPKLRYDNILLAAFDEDDNHNSSWSADNGSEQDIFDLEDEFVEASKEEVFDPLNGYNRFMTKVNDKLYFWVLKPVARGYSKIMPASARIAVNRFFNNLLFPIRFVNNTLQMKFKRAGVELARFGINTTVGILGFRDPAKEWLELDAYPEDFGQTLGHYGVGGGIHIVLPLIGPSNLRDMAGMIPDHLLDPVSYADGNNTGNYLLNPESYITDRENEFAIRTFNTVNYTSLHIGEYESIKKDALDLYTFLRDAYEQNRRKKIEE